MQGLGVEVVQVTERACGEEAFAYKANGALDAAFLISPVRCDGSWGEAVVCSEFEQGGIKADGVPTSFKHGAFEVVVQCDTRHGAEELERLDVAAQEVGHSAIEVEA